MKFFSSLCCLLFLLQALPLQAQDVLLRKSDVVIISISGVPESEQAQINKSYPVNSQGQVRLPYISSLSAAGLRADALAQKIEAAYRSQEIFTRPRVTVTTPEEETVQRRITIMGEVSKPGIQQYQNNMTILEAIAQAGNPTPYADMKKVRLIRAGKTYELDLRRVSEDTSKDIALEPGDRIIIPE